MPVDVTKIKPGDEILVKLVVHRLDDELALVAGPPNNPQRNYISCSTIVGHTPKPPEIKAGMQFSYGGAIYDILFADDQTLCYRNKTTLFPGAMRLDAFLNHLKGSCYKLL